MISISKCGAVTAPQCPNAIQMWGLIAPAVSKVVYSGSDWRFHGAGTRPHLMTICLHGRMVDETNASLPASIARCYIHRKRPCLSMHVIKKKTLEAYATQYPDAAEPLRSWRKLMERQDFRDLIRVGTVIALYT